MDREKIHTTLLVFIAGLLALNAYATFSRPSLEEIEARIKLSEQRTESRITMNEQYIDSRIQHWAQHFGSHFSNEIIRKSNQ